MDCSVCIQDAAGREWTLEAPGGALNQILVEREIGLFSSFLVDAEHNVLEAEKGFFRNLDSNKVYQIHSVQGVPLREAENSAAAAAARAPLGMPLSASPSLTKDSRRLSLPAHIMRSKKSGIWDETRGQRSPIELKATRERDLAELERFIKRAKREGRPAREIIAAQREMELMQNRFKVLSLREKQRVQREKQVTSRASQMLTNRRAAQEQRKSTRTRAIENAVKARVSAVSSVREREAERRRRMQATEQALEQRRAGAAEARSSLSAALQRSSVRQEQERAQRRLSVETERERRNRITAETYADTYDRNAQTAEEVKESLASSRRRAQTKERERRSKLQARVVSAADQAPGDPKEQLRVCEVVLADAMGPKDSLGIDVQASLRVFDSADRPVFAENVPPGESGAAMRLTPGSYRVCVFANGYHDAENTMVVTKRFGARVCVGMVPDEDSSGAYVVVLTWRHLPETLSMFAELPEMRAMSMATALSYGNHAGVGLARKQLFSPALWQTGATISIYSARGLETVLQPPKNRTGAMWCACSINPAAGTVDAVGLVE